MPEIGAAPARSPGRRIELDRSGVLPRFPPGDYGQKHHPRPRRSAWTIGLILMLALGVAALSMLWWFATAPL